MNAALKVVSTPPPDPVEAEFDKDVWDVRNIPGVRYAAHESHYLLNFDNIPAPFRVLVKPYLRFLLAQNSYGTCRQALRFLRLFVLFISETLPEATGFENLQRSHMEAYLQNVCTKFMTNGKVSSRMYNWNAAHYSSQFLSYLERTSNPQAPKISTSRLIWREDGGKAHRSYSTAFKHIPESVLQQLEQHIDKLPAYVLPVIILLRASGWRISDVLNLRHDTCLERTSSGWWLCGDIPKTQVINHKVPITDEIANIVAAQRALVQEKITDADNPQRYLFPALTQQRKGRPLTANSVSDALNKLAADCNITDEMGKVYHFRLHAFRHTKGVELINNGMSLVHVQKWMAHVSPEMTLAYAKILDPTLRQEWEKAFAKGAVRLDTNGSPTLLDTTQLVEGENVEWEHIRHNLDAVRLPNGYCFKPKKADCPTQAIPCHTCHTFCTTREFLPQLQNDRRGMLELIELGEKAGNTTWVERNRQNLDKLEPIITLLEAGDIHHPAGKGVREYTPQERERRQQDGK